MDGIILENCSRYLSITKLFLASKDITDIKKASTQIRAANWKSCFLSCCYLSSCREVVYGTRTGCLHIRCSGPFRFCKYRPNELNDSSIHGMIIGERHPGEYDEHLLRMSVTVTKLKTKTWNYCFI